jgi:type III secretory pathway lipoprotein EscJ
MARTLPLLWAALFTMTCADKGEVPVSTPVPRDERFEELVTGSLFSTHDENQMLRNHALAKELERTLELLDGVERARVHLNLKDDSLLSLSKVGESRAAVLIVAADYGPDEGEIRRFTEAAVPGLEPEHVAVFVNRPRHAAKTMTFVGPFEVATSSARQLRGVLGGLLGLTLLMALALIAAGYRTRKLRKPRR